MPYRKPVDVLNAETVHKVFEYDRETGKLYRKYLYSKKEVGTTKNRMGIHKSDEALVVGWDNNQYPVTHIIWLIAYGKWPESNIEHKDINPANNRLDNLREANQSQNMANIDATFRSRSGVKGVFWDKERLKWAAYIGFNYKTRFIGRFNTIEEAKTAYDAKARELFGEFARS